MGGADGGNWRGVLRGVCGAGRAGVDGAEGSCCVDPSAFLSVSTLSAWAVEQWCPLLDHKKVIRATMEGGRMDELKWGQSRVLFAPRRLLSLAADEAALATA
eukprot:jgi/Tetstr1/442773/TSEL_030858.t1